MAAPSSQPDPFDLLGLAPSFDLAPGVIDRAYLARIARLHPDAAGEQHPDEHSADDATASMNHARRILASSEQRANALLARIGGPTKEEDKRLPSGFLQEFMAMRMEAEDALAGGDPQARAHWKDRALRERAAYEARVGPLLARALAGPNPSSDALAEIRRELNAWRYVERLIEQLDPAYDPRRADFS